MVRGTLEVKMPEVFEQAPGSIRLSRADHRRTLTRVTPGYEPGPTLSTSRYDDPQWGVTALWSPSQPGRLGELGQAEAPHQRAGIGPGGTAAHGIINALPHPWVHWGCASGGSRGELNVLNRGCPMTASHSAPPPELDRPLEVAPEDWSHVDFYHLVNALVIPRPIGWISTLSGEGVRNLAPYSHFNLMGSDPFFVAFASTEVKDTVANVREVPEFVCNIVTVDLLEKMNFTSGNFPRDEDEFGWAGLTPMPGAMVRPFRVAEAKAHLECELVQVVSDHNTHIVVGRIMHAHVDPSVWKDGRVDPRLLNPVCRLAGSSYATLGELFSVQRPSWNDITGTADQEAMPPAVKR